MHSHKASLKVGMASLKANRALIKTPNARKAVVVAVASVVAAAVNSINVAMARPQANKALIKTQNVKKAAVAGVASAVAAAAPVSSPNVVTASFEGSNRVSTTTLNARRAVVVVASAAAKIAVDLLQDPRTTS